MALRRFYLRIYVALLSSLAAFALAAGLMWRYVLDEFDTHEGLRLKTAFAEVALPAPERSRDELQPRLAQLHNRLGGALAVYAANGELLASAGPLPVPLPSADGAAERLTLAGQISTMPLSDGRWVVVRGPPGYEEPMSRFLLLLAATVAAIGVGSYPIVRGLTRRVEALKDAVEHFGSGDLSRRVRISGKDEIAALAESFNRSADRVAALLSAHKTLLANASHELRSPLARLRMGMEILQTHAEPELHRELERNIAELDELVDEILLASRLDAIETIDNTHDVDLLGLVAEECAAAGAAIEGVPLVVRGNAKLLRRLVRNLLDNAERHAPGGSIDVRLERAQTGHARLCVCDRGPGVAHHERERIFEPFYRPAGTREREGGVGLGLALVRQIARHHGGDARCLPRRDGGTCLEILLSVTRPIHASEKT